MNFQPVSLFTSCNKVHLSEVTKANILFSELKCLPKTIYLDLLYQHIEEEKNWEQLFKTFFHCREEDVLDHLHDLTTEQAIILQNHPSKCPEFGYEKNYFVSTTYSVNFVEDKKAYCYECCKRYLKNSKSYSKVIIQTLNVSFIDLEDLLSEITQNDNSWCNDCKYKPLFRVEEVTKYKTQIYQRQYYYQD